MQPCDLNFDLNNNGNIDLADEISIRNIQNLSPAEFDVVYKKIMSAVDGHSGLSRGDAEFLNEFDVNRNGKIDADDKNMISKALTARIEGGAPILNPMNRPSGVVGTKVLVSGKNLFALASTTTFAMKAKNSSAFYSTSIFGSPEQQSFTFIVPSKVFDREGGITQVETPIGEYELFVKTAGGASNSLTYTVVAQSYSITLLSPNGGETFKIGDIMRVSWSSRGLSSVGQKVAVNLVKRDGVSPSTSFKIADVEASAGAVDFSVNLPSNIAVGGNFLVEVSAIGLNVSVFDGSNGKFSIVAGDTIPLPTITFYSNPKEVSSGAPTQLSWTTLGAVKCTASSGTPAWPGEKPVYNGTQIVYPTSTTEFKLDCANSVGQIANASVTVSVNNVAPSITVISPNGGETYKTGDTVTINWNASGLSSDNTIGLQLAYLTSSGNIYEDVIIPSNLNKTSYSWLIPAKYGTGMVDNRFKIRAIIYGVTSSNPPQDYSDSYFTIIFSCDTPHPFRRPKSERLGRASYGNFGKSCVTYMVFHRSDILCRKRIFHEWSDK